MFTCFASSSTTENEEIFCVISPLNLFFQRRTKAAVTVGFAQNYAREWERKQNAVIIWGFLRVRISLPIIAFMTNWIFSHQSFFLEWVLVLMGFLVHQSCLWITWMKLDWKFDGKNLLKFAVKLTMGDKK